MREVGFLFLGRVDGGEVGCVRVFVSLFGVLGVSEWAFFKVRGFRVGFLLFRRGEKYYIYGRVG